MDIENVAASTVKLAISKTDYLSPYVNDGDKEPSWDGHIYAFSESIKNKESFLGRAPVQVKGKLSENFSEEKIKYQVKVSDLKNYCLDGGTLYFVVLIDNDSNTKIYYSALLPYEINRILEDVYEQKSKSVTFLEFPNSKNEITNIIINFIHDRDNQVLLRNGKNLSLDEIIEQMGPDKLTYGFSYTGIGYDINKPYEYLFNHDIYLYAENKELNMRFPINHVWKTDLAKVQVPGSVYAAGIEYYKEYDVVHKIDCDELHIGKSMILCIKPDGSSKINYHLRGDLREQIVAQMFLINILKDRIIIVNGAQLEIGLSSEEIGQMHLPSATKYLNYLVQIQEVLDMLGIQESLKIDELSKKDEDYINMLILAFKHGRAISFQESIIPLVANININNICILLHFREKSDGNYLLENFFDCKIDGYSYYENDEKFNTSQFVILKEEDFMHISNINFEKIVQDVLSIENEGHFIKTNQLLLEMLKAFDKRNNDVLINTAISIATWLVEKEKEKDIAIINLYQCYFRMRRLTYEEIDTLYDIIKRRKEDIFLIVGAYILLEENRMTHRFYYMLPIEDQKNFKQFPIYSLWKEG